MHKWNKEDIPHKGWTCIDMEDLGEASHTCELCSHESIRYVHVMKHPQYKNLLKVGCVCAEHLEDDYINPKIREKNFKNKLKRRLTFLDKDWDLKPNGNLVLKYKKLYITILPSKFKKDEYGIMFDGKLTWSYKGNKIVSFKTAQMIAFELVDAYLG